MKLEHIESLKYRIYLMLMNNTDADMCDMGECMDMAESVIEEWISRNNIKIQQ